MKRILKTSIATLLVLTILFNVNIPALQAHADAAMSSTGIITAQKDSWNTVASLAANGSINTLPDMADSKESITRTPDIGGRMDDSFNFWTWLIGLFTEDTLAKSKGVNSSSVIYKDITGSGVEVRSGNKSVNLTPTSGSFNNYATTDCAVRYTNVFDGVDYQFASFDGGAQIKALYEGVSDNNNFEFKVSCSDGLSLEAQDGGFTILKGDKPQFVISAPFAKDIGGAEGGAELALDDSGNLVLSVDEDWMQELSRAYPVSVGFNISRYETVVPKVLKSGKVFNGASTGGTFEVNIASGGYSIVEGTIGVGSAEITGVPDGEILVEVGEYSGTEKVFGLAEIGIGEKAEIHITADGSEVLPGETESLIVIRAIPHRKVVQ